MKDKVDSPVGVLEDYFKSSESETSSSSKELSVNSESRDISKSSSRWQAILQLLRTRSRKYSISTLHPLSIFKLSRTMSSSMREIILPSSLIGADSTSSHRSPKIFTQHEIQIATNYFDQGICNMLQNYISH